MGQFPSQPVLGNSVAPGAVVWDLAANSSGIDRNSVPSAAGCCEEATRSSKYFCLSVSISSLLCSGPASLSCSSSGPAAFNHTTASPGVARSHIILGKSKAIKPLSERKLGLSEGGTCLLCLSTLLSPLEKWIFWTLQRFKKTCKRSKTVLVAK